MSIFIGQGITPDDSISRSGEAGAYTAILAGTRETISKPLAGHLSIYADVLAMARGLVPTPIRRVRSREADMNPSSVPKSAAVSSAFTSLRNIGFIF